MNADGSNRTKLADYPPLLFTNREWSPDSRKIAFQYWTGDYQDIYVLDVDDGSYRDLSNSNNGTFDGNPVWSSDGQKIAFTGISEGEVDFYVMHASDGSGQKQIAKMKPSIVNTPLDWINSLIPNR